MWAPLEDAPAQGAGTQERQHRSVSSQAEGSPGRDWGRGDFTKEVTVESHSFKGSDEGHSGQSKEHVPRAQESLGNGGGFAYRGIAWGVGPGL